MFNAVISCTKIAAYATWLLFLLSLIGVLSAPFSTYAIILFSMMIAVHVLCYCFVKIKFNQLKEVTFIQSMLIGYAHWLPMIVGFKSQPKDV